MTPEEAQIVIGNIPIKPEVLDDCYDITEYQEAKTMAIKALEQTERIAKLVKELDLADISPEYFDDMFYLQSVKEVKEEMWRMYCFAKDVDYTLN